MGLTEKEGQDPVCRGFSPLLQGCPGAGGGGRGLQHQTVQGAAGDVSEIFHLCTEHHKHMDEGLSAGQQSCSTARAHTYSKSPRHFSCPWVLITASEARGGFTASCPPLHTSTFILCRMSWGREERGEQGADGELEERWDLFRSRLTYRA